MEKNPLMSLLTKDLSVTDKYTEELLSLSTEDGFLSNTGNKLFEATKSIVNKFKNGLTGIVSGLKSTSVWMTDSITGTNTVKLINATDLSNKRSGTDVKDKDFRTIEGMSLMTIPGMQTRLIFTNTIVSENLIKISKEYESKLDMLDSILSRFITDPEVRKSFRSPSKDVDDMRNASIETIDSIKEQFDTSDLNELKPFDSIIGNFREYQSNLSLSSDINKAFTVKDLEKVNKYSNKIADRLDVILDVLGDGSLVASKESIKGLISTADAVGNYFTLISSLYYMHTKIMEIEVQAKKIIKK